MGLITPIYIKPDKYFYSYYNDYITKNNNSESDYFILNLLKCKSKLMTPTFITKNDLQHYDNCKLLDKTNNLNLSQEYYETFKSNVINNKHVCNVCYENVTDNYVITQCLHTYCIKCANTLYFNNKKHSLVETTDTNFYFKKINNSISRKEFKCPMCNHSQNQEQLFLLTDKILTDIENQQNCKKDNKKDNKKQTNCYLSLIKVLYNTVLSIKKNKFTYNVNKNFIYKYVGYKTYYILNKIIENKSPFNIIENDILNYNKTQHIKIILSNNPKWIELMNIIVSNNNIHLCLVGNMPQYIDELINSINDNSNKSNNYIHFHLYLVDPYNKVKYDAIKSNLNNLMLHISSSTDITYKNIKISPYQLVIKNTIDEKIFTNKVIIT